MSATTTTTAARTSTTLLGLLPSMTTATALIPGKNCPTCGHDVLLSQDHNTNIARRRVQDLEGQVQFLNSQTVQMAAKLAEYEDEMRRLRAQASSHNHNTRNGSSISSTYSTRSNHIETDHNQQQQQQQQGGRLSSLASLLPYRRPSTASGPRQGHAPTHSGASASFTSSPPQPPRSAGSAIAPEEALELQNALNREQSLRKAAESQLSQASTELEELTAQLFSQANEMVAQERKARARLEERVAVLERRDVEKRNRLERLEKAMERVERIRALVG